MKEEQIKFMKELSEKAQQDIIEGSWKFQDDLEKSMKRFDRNFMWGLFLIAFILGVLLFLFIIYMRN